MQLPLRIDPGHPALSGHFPGQPVVPGALLLDEALHAIEQQRELREPGYSIHGWELEVVKFHRPARPGEAMQLSIEPLAPQSQKQRYAFEIAAGATLIASGRLSAVDHSTSITGSGISDSSAAVRSSASPAAPPAAAARVPGAVRHTTADQGWRDRPERGSELLVRWMVAISLHLGRPVGRLFLHIVVAYYFCFAPTAAAAMRSYLRRALRRAARPIDRLRQITTFATTIHDRLWLLRRQDDMFDITLEGEQVVREAVTSGGAFLMGAHMGSFEVLRLVGRRQGFTVAITMYEAQAQRLNRYLHAVAPNEALEIIPVGRVDSMLRIRDSLDQGHLVGVLADRLFGAEPSLPVTFLGATAQFPLNPMRLAAMLRRRVVFMLGLYRGGNRYHVVFEPVADFTHVTPQTRAAAIESAVRRYAQLLECRCRTDPYNWFNFFDFWPNAPATATEADTAEAHP